MTTSLPPDARRHHADYDDEDRWLDDRDGGWRWQSYAACRDADPRLFFPVEVEVRNVDGQRVEVPTDEEPAFPPPEAREICHRCPVAGRCLERNMDQDFGVYGGTTGYQRRLMTKRIVRKRCMRCGGEDLVKNNNQKKELCLACGISWDIL